MTPHDAFLQAIRDNPEDDAVRLIYADYLEEKGDPAGLDRAEFIRLQLELGRLPADSTDRATLLARGRRLLREHEAEWVAGDLRGLVRGGEFRRGFVEKVALPAEVFPQRADELIRLAPLREVHLTGRRDVVRQLARTPLLGQLSGLDLKGNFLNDSDLAWLVESPFLGRLTRLDLSNNARRYWPPSISAG